MHELNENQVANQLRRRGFGCQLQRTEKFDGIRAILRDTPIVRA